MIHHFKTDRELIGVMLPKGAKSPVIFQGMFSYYMDEYPESIDLPKGNYRLLIEDVSRATEEDAEKVVEKTDNPIWQDAGKVFIDYTNTQNCFLTALESLATLLEREKMYSVNPCGEEPEYDDFVDLTDDTDNVCLIQDCQVQYTDAYNQWKEAEARTGVWAIIQRIS